MDIDRTELFDRIEELAQALAQTEFEDEGAMDMADDFRDLCLLRDLFYLEDEGFIEIDSDGGCTPIAEPVVLHLP